MSLQIRGEDAFSVFQYESGGHRWQRVPPNEKRGRVHTSTVTIAVLEEPRPTQLEIKNSDLEWSFSRGSGAGGQHRNKTESAVDLVHRPTGVRVHCESERSQQQNKAIALTMLRARLWEAQKEKDHQKRSQQRKDQLGAGKRGDKTWTVRTQDDTVTYHPTNQKLRLKEYMDGRYIIR